ncbi:MAG: hypothetical protein F6K35_07150 [Okeania sp. SIO2H7]|nr:hypothetical protein [Okeania sp. SIO2H7]
MFLIAIIDNFYKLDAFALGGRGQPKSVRELPVREQERMGGGQWEWRSRFNIASPKLLEVTYS